MFIKASDTGSTNVVSVGPAGPTSTERIMKCRPAGTDTVSSVLDSNLDVVINCVDLVLSKKAQINFFGSVF